jgi:hypothetical protein
MRDLHHAELILAIISTSSLCDLLRSLFFKPSVNCFPDFIGIHDPLRFVIYIIFPLSPFQGGLSAENRVKEKCLSHVFLMVLNLVHFFF